MDNLVNKKLFSLKCSLPIKFFSIISFVCTAIYCVSRFFYYDTVLDINGEIIYELALHSIKEYSTLALLEIALEIIPIILFIIYIFVFHTKSNGAILVPFVFLLFAVEYLTIYLSIFQINYEIDLLTILLGTILISLPFISSLLAAISAFKGLNKKGIVATALIICALYEIIMWFATQESNIIYYKEYWENSLFLLILRPFSNIIGKILFHIVLLLFSIKNKIKPTFSLSPQKENEKIEKMSPEKALMYLKDKYEFGVITAEEYQSKRQEIINKL